MGAFTDGWDKQEWKQQRRRSKAQQPQPQVSNGALHQHERYRHLQELGQEKTQKTFGRGQEPPQDRQGQHLEHMLRRRDKHQRLAQDIALALLQRQLTQVLLHFRCQTFTVTLPSR